MNPTWPLASISECSLLGELACQSVLIPEDTGCSSTQVEFKLERLTLSSVFSGLGAGSPAECVAGQAAPESRAAAQIRAQSRVKLTPQSVVTLFRSVSCMTVGLWVRIQKNKILTALEI